MKFAVLGASRGLGRELVLQLAQLKSLSGLLLSSRKGELLQKVKIESGGLLGRDSSIEIFPADFTRSAEQNALFESLQRFQPTHIAYTAGGGPYGYFGSREWKDHQWALELNLLFPTRLLHFATSDLLGKGLKQIVFVGSDIAERQPDVRATSYAAAKHGLYGLVSSLDAEGAPLDVRLYSPGYMDTDMLPKSAPARQLSRVYSPQEVAKDLVDWLLQEKSSFHRTTDSI